MEPRLAIVTGSSKGIGEACARRFLDEGLSVVGSPRLHLPSRWHRTRISMLSSATWPIRKPGRASLMPTVK